MDYVRRISLQFKAEAERRMRAAAEVPFGPDSREAVQKMDPLQKAMWWVAGGSVLGGAEGGEAGAMAR